jgi:hypothetical protein
MVSRASPPTGFLKSGIGEEHIPGCKLFHTRQIVDGTEKSKIEIPVMHFVDELFEVIEAGIEYDLHNNTIAEI